MCIICVEYMKAKMTRSEAREVLGEMRGTNKLTDEHADEVEALLSEDEEDDDLLSDP